MTQPTPAARPARRMGWYALALLVPLVAIAIPLWNGRSEPARAPASSLEGVPPATLDRALEILRRAEAEPHLSRTSLAGELAALGAPAAGVATELLARGRVPARRGHRAGDLEERQRQVLMELLGQVEPARLFEHLRRRAAAEPAPASVAAAIGWFERFAGADHVQRLIQIAMVRERAQGVDADVLRAFRSALDAILRRDRRAMPALGRCWRWAEADLWSTVARAIGASDDPRGLDVLCEMLRATRDIDGLILIQIGQLAPMATPPYSDALLSALRERLAADAEGVRKGAAAALAKLGDVAAFPELFALLGADSPVVREDARWALEQVTGQPFPPVAEPWIAWYETEREWREREAPAAVMALQDSEDRASAALRAIAQHPLYRHELAAECAPALCHPSVAVRVLACETLAALGSWIAAEALVAALDDAEGAVAEAAHASLTRLTGWEHPHSGDAWRQALGELRPGP